jgi:hypothetical protein
MADFCPNGESSRTGSSSMPCPAPAEEVSRVGPDPFYIRRPGTLDSRNPPFRLLKKSRRSALMELFHNPVNQNRAWPEAAQKIRSQKNLQPEDP